MEIQKVDFCVPTQDIHHRTGTKKEAIEFRNVYKKPSGPSRPSAPPASLAEVYSYVRAQDWPKALNAAKGAIQVQPELAEAYHLAGLAAGQIYGLKSDESRSYYAKYVELEPDPSKKAFVKDIFPDLLK